MISYDQIVNNRLIFYFDLIMILDEEKFVYVDDINDMLREFAIKNINEYYNSLKLVFNIRRRKGEFTFGEPDDMQEQFQEFFDDIRHDFSNINKYYNKVHDSDLDKISELATAFADFYFELDSPVMSLIPS